MIKEGILFLGTAGDVDIMSSQRRGSGGIILFLEGKQIHINPGPGALLQLVNRGITPSKHDLILVSRQHVVEASDTNALLSAMTRHGVDKHGMLCYPESLEENLICTAYEQFVKSKVIKKEETISLDPIRITATPTKSKEGGVGYRMSTSKFTIHYVGHTSFSAEVVKAHKDAGILIVNLSLPRGFSQEGHLNTDDVIALVNATNPQVVVLTGFTREVLDNDPLSQARMIQKETGVQTIAAKDSLFLSPSDYHLRLAQKTLGSYSSSQQ